MIPFLILSLASFAIGLLAVAPIRQHFSQQLLDIPNDRICHTQPTPRGGGLGFIIAFAIASGLASALPQLLNTQPLTPKIVETFDETSFLWLILTPLAIIGIIDDQRGVPAGLRYLVQLAVAGIAVACFGSFPQPWLTSLGIAGQITSYAFTLIGITALINFFNFMDLGFLLMQFICKGEWGTDSARYNFERPCHQVERLPL